MNGTADTPTPGLEQNLEFMSVSSATAASSFAAVLDIMLSTQEKWRTRINIKSLRGTCKAARRVIDFHVRSFCCSPCERYDPGVGLFRDFSPWPWPNITEVVLKVAENLGGVGVLQREVEDFTSLPLSKLKTLCLGCHNVMPLVQSNWPNLENLDLEVSKSIDPFPGYPKDLQFPIWPSLNKLCLQVDDGADITFLDPLLRSCSNLNHLAVANRIGASIRTLDEEVAAIIASAPLSNLDSLMLPINASRDFYFKLFEKKWPKLRYFISHHCCESILPILTAQNWLINLEELELKSNQTVTVDMLCTFLKTLEKGPIRWLALNNLRVTVLEGFRGIVFEKLKYLRINEVFTSDNGEHHSDVSDYLNLLFNCFSFPQLDNLDIGFDEEEDSPVDGPLWDRPPRLGTYEQIDIFPLLECISLTGLVISIDVANYLSIFHKTNCHVAVEDCDFIERGLSQHRHELLEKLDLNFDEWKEFLQENECNELYEDLMFWNVMSDAEFKRIAYAIALHNSTNVWKFQKFLRLCEADPDGCGLTADVVESLKGYLQRLLDDRSTFMVEQQLTWDVEHYYELW